MQIYSDGIPVFNRFAAIGPMGPDGNPIGTIISYMGKTAPEDYLICDGKTYNTYDYPDLADFFEQQFGDKYYFGGSDEKFAVPDMRNLFVRGYHGTADEQLSGEIGKKQEATIHPNVEFHNNNYLIFSSNQDGIPGEMDSSTDNINRRSLLVSGGDNSSMTTTYTSRPINMAILYCIKAVKAEPCGDIYSEEERVIGRWVDGKPIYRKVIDISNFNLSANTNTIVYRLSDVDTVIHIDGICSTSNGMITNFNNSTTTVQTKRSTGDIYITVLQTSILWAFDHSYLICYYTKTTD